MLLLQFVFFNNLNKILEKIKYLVVLSSRLDFYKETISRKEYNSKLKYFDKKKPILVLVGGGIKTQSGTLENWTGELEEDELGEAPE
jgi:hypothetical protein